MLTNIQTRQHDITCLLYLFDPNTYLLRKQSVFLKKAASITRCQRMMNHTHWRHKRLEFMAKGNLWHLLGCNLVWLRSREYQTILFFFRNTVTETTHGDRLNIGMLSYQHMDCHHKDEAVYSLLEIHRPEKTVVTLNRTLCALSNVITIIYFSTLCWYIFDISYQIDRSCLALNEILVA